MALLYVAEDDNDIREVICASLSTFQYEIQGFSDGQALLDACTKQLPDCILLDVMMPVLDGIATLKQLRSHTQTQNIPIIMLTAKASDLDKVTGLEAGADDYITKPFAILELSARVKATLRMASRYQQDKNQEIFSYGPITLNTSIYTLTVNGTTIFTTRKEYNLLLVLMKASPGVVPRQDLLQQVWGYSFEGGSRTLDMHIRSLRVKLQNIPCIHTVRGVGYRFLWEGITDEKTV